MMRPAIYAFPDDDDATLDFVLRSIAGLWSELVVTPLGGDRDRTGSRRACWKVEAFTPAAAEAFAVASRGMARQIG